MNKLVRNIIILIAALAVLGGGLWWVMTVEPEGEEEEQQTPAADYETVYKTEEDGVSAVTIERDGSALKFTKEGDKWTLEGYDLAQVSQTKVKSLVSSLSSISSANHITDNIEECGLDSPQIIVKITVSDGRTDIIKIGKMSPVLGQYFFNVNDGEIYTMTSYKVDDLLKEASHYTSFSRLELTGADIFDIRIERAGGNNIHLREMAENDGSLFNTWELAEPYSQPYSANDQYVQENILAKLEAIDISTLAQSSATGLASPKAVVTVTSAPTDEEGNRGEETKTVLKIGNTAGDITYVEYEGAAYEVDTSSVSFVDTDEFLMVSKLLALVPIQNLNSMSITYGDKAYNFEVGHSAMGEDDDEMNFTINGAAAGEKKAKSAYQEVIGLAADGVYKGGALGDTIAEIVFSSADSEKVITFKSINDMSASFTVDGITDFTVKKSTLTSMLDKLAEFAQNPS